MEGGNHKFNITGTNLYIFVKTVIHLSVVGLQ
jgi:hypothetical protein